MDIPNQQHHRHTIRLSHFDYSQPGYYFVTVCTKDRREWFGEIRDGSVLKNKYGLIVEQQWCWLQEQYSYVELDEYVVMPNHVHGIIAINGDLRVGAGRDLPLQVGIAAKIKPLHELVGAFKTTSSKLIHQSGLSEFQWQRNYYEHIIRNEQSLSRIREYIQNNPLQWELDIENPKCVKPDKEYYEKIF